MVDIKRYLDQEGMEKRSFGDILKAIKRADPKLFPEIHAACRGYPDNGMNSREFHSLMARKAGNITPYDYFKSQFREKGETDLQYIAENIGLEPGKRIVDVCCGTGLEAVFTGLELGDKGQVIGIDLSREMIQRAKERAQKYRLGNTSFIVADSFSIPLANESADGVIYLNSLAEDSPENGGDSDFLMSHMMVSRLKECNRILRNHGKIICDFEIDMPFEDKRLLEYQRGIIASALHYAGFGEKKYKLVSCEPYQGIKRHAVIFSAEKTEGEVEE